MICKMLEIRDRATFIPAMAIRLVPACEADRHLLAAAGFTTDPASQATYVLLLRFNPEAMQYDPWKWSDASCTMREAHIFIRRNFDDLESGSVVDVEYILGETTQPKTPQ